MSGNMPDPENGRHDRLPAPEGVNLLGTPERVAENTDAARRRYAIGPFGQAWLWTFSIVLLLTSLYKAVAGPLLAVSLPTTKGTVLGWITIPARTITYVPKVSYEVGGNTYHFVAGTAVSTLSDAPTTVTVSYVPFAPATAIWFNGQWWMSFLDTYLMVLLILGIILFCVAIYQWRIRGYWKSSVGGVGARGARLLIWIGAVVALGGYAWLASAYLEPASWFVPPEPNLLAAFIAAIGTALLVTGVHYRRRGPVRPSDNPALADLTAQQRAAFDTAMARAKAEQKAKGHRGKSA